MQKYFRYQMHLNEHFSLSNFLWFEQIYAISISQSKLHGRCYLEISRKSGYKEGDEREHEP